MKTYRAAIVGLTGIAAAEHRSAPAPVLGKLMPHSHAAAYDTTPHTEVVAVCDLVPDLGARFTETWAGTFPEVHAYTDYREMLSKENIDILSVATSDHRHADIVVDAAEAGVKGIFCEKPLATTLADADRMIAACEKHNVPLLVDHTRRWFPEYLEARRVVQSGEIGRLRVVYATWGGPRAMLFRNGTHLIDTICFFVESDPVWLVGRLGEGETEYGPRYAGDGGRDPGTDPGCSGYVEFANGVRAFLNLAKQTPVNFELDLVGETGRVRIGRSVGEVWRSGGREEATTSRLETSYPTRSDMVAAIEELISLIERGGTASSSGADGRRTLSIVLGILQSNVAGGQPIRFPIQDA